MTDLGENTLIFYQILSTHSLLKMYRDQFGEFVCVYSGAPNDNFRKIICSEDDLRSRIFGSFSDKFLACLPLLGFSNFKKIV